MTEQEQAAVDSIHPEFFARVNDIIEQVNRLERRLDSHHAEMVILHAFARYSGHHYLQVTKNDSEEERQAFADYIAAEVRQFVLKHLLDLVGEAKAPAVEGEEKAAE